MRIRLPDLESASSLISFLREEGFIAYFDAGNDTVEAIDADAEEDAEASRLRDAVGRWRSRHPNIELEALPNTR